MPVEFDSPTTTHDEMSTDGSTEVVSQRILTWWAEVQKKGERQALVRGGRTGRHKQSPAGPTAAGKVPRCRAAAIIRGAMKTKDDWIGERLIDLAAEIKGDAPVPFLLQQMTEGSCQACAWRLPTACSATSTPRH